MWRAVITLFAMCVATAAGAHAFLDHAVPPVGATVGSSPPALRLYFSERIEPRFSAVELSTSAGRPVKIGAVAVDPHDPFALAVALPPLPPGRYRVHWHAVSVDRHPSEGGFEFEVRP